MSNPSATLANGNMSRSIINDTYNIYTFTTPQSVNLRSGSIYTLMVQGVSQTSIPSWETITLNDQLIRTQSVARDAANPGTFAVKFTQTGDVTGALKGRLNYNTQHSGDTPNLTWILQTPLVTIMSGTASRSAFGTQSVYTIEKSSVSLAAGAIYTLTVSGLTNSVKWWESIQYNSNLLRPQTVSTSPDYIVAITPATTGVAAQFSARLNSGGSDASVSWSLTGLPNIRPAPPQVNQSHTFVTAGSFGPVVANGSATGQLSASWYTVLPGSYALVVDKLDSAISTAWENMTGPDGNITPEPITLVGETGYTVRFSVAGSGQLGGTFRYGSTKVPANIGWILYKFNA